MLTAAASPQAVLEPEQVSGVVWGKETNSLRAGVLVQKTRSSPTAIKCILYFENKSNIDVLVWVPKVNQRYQVALIGTNNVPVPLTRIGRQLGQRVEEHPHFRTRKTEYIPQILSPRFQDSFIPPFLLSDYFDIKVPGRYRLEIEPRLYLVDPSDAVSSITLPTISTEIIVDEVPK